MMKSILTAMVLVVLVVSAASGAEAASIGIHGTNNATTPSTKFDLLADIIELRAQLNVSTISIVPYGPASVLTNDITVSGPAANGRDQSSSFTDPSFIHFYWIWNGTTLATVSSSTAPPAGPQLPSGYTHWAYAGAVHYTSGALKRAHLQGAWIYYEASQNVLASGTATTETAVSVAAVVPPNALAFTVASRLSITASGGSANMTLLLGFVSGTTHRTIRPAVGGVSGGSDAWDTGPVDLPNRGQQYYYSLSIASGTNYTVDTDVLSYKVPNGGE